MASNGEARQYSFTMGEISPEKYYTPNEVTYQQGLAKAENVIIKASGGVETRGGTDYKGVVDSELLVTDSQVAHEITFTHPVTKGVHTLSFKKIPMSDGYSLYLDGQDIMSEVKRKHYVGYPTFSLAVGGKFLIPDNIKLSYSMSSEYLIITPALKVYSDTFAGYPDLSYFGGDAISGYFTETIIALAFSKPFSYASYITSSKGIRVISNFGGQLTTPLKEDFPDVVKVTAGGSGTPPATSARVSYLITATRKDGTEEVYMAVRSADVASTNITSTLNIVCRQYIDAASTGPLYYPDSGYRTSLKIEGIWLHKEMEGLPKYKYFNIYRGVENDPNFTTSFSLVTRFPVYKSSSNKFTIKFTDYGESDPSITPPMDRSFFIQNPSIIELGADTSVSTFSPNKIISSAFYQSRLFVALAKSQVFDNEATTSNTILASKLNAPEQMAMPLITNPAEAFSFQVPEESGGYLTHLAASARLIAFTNRAVFVFMGDDAGTLTPLALNPIKVYHVGAKENVPPCTFGEYTFFAMEGVPSVGFIRITSQGEVSYGDALPISRHLLEDKGDEVVGLRALTGPDTSQIRIQILTKRNKLIELTGTEGVFGLSRVESSVHRFADPEAIAENYTIAEYSSLNTRGVGGIIYRPYSATTSNYSFLVRTLNLNNLNRASRFFNPYIDFAMRTGFFDGKTWEPIVEELTGVGYNSYLVDPTPDAEVYFDSGVLDWSAGQNIAVKVKQDNSSSDATIYDQYGGSGTPSFVTRKFALKLYIKDSEGQEHTITGELGSIGTTGDNTLVFTEEVPEVFRDKVFKMYCHDEDYANFLSPRYLDGTYGIAVMAADKLVVPLNYNNNYFTSLARLKGINTFTAGTEVHFAMFADGEIISEEIDDTSPCKAVVFYDGVDGYWEIDFNGQFFSTLNIGMPYVSEIQTLPLEVAVGQGDSISDAGKLISAAAVSLYQTDSLQIGEIGQPSEYMEEVDFSDPKDPTKIVKFNGVKEYNFSASWNKHGMIRLRSKPFRSFSISSITPKGNVSI